ncbi:phosphatase PAP2 family protein [Subtercola frigoramans]|uniref:Undecaprenyl-diphosphatase n=1 Tax=Subtercola frigoramans TaxID=120298 RepID=A0ABS2L894_9MICO|nr:phosphatase PAP2 family protein [Subtercola frigoramans]MBM7473302.1 undecaprenyl-diphosphatase [Subtercola frigoramans]
MSTLRERESAGLARLQQSRFGEALIPPAKLLSLFGEHAAGWILLGILGAAIDWTHALLWLWSVFAVVVAHGLSIVIKRVIRRPRPSGNGVVVHSTAPSKLSFPSSHASSTMAAAVVYAAFFPWLWPVAVIVVLAMGFSRLLLGMHFPTDILAGFAIGLIVGIPTILLLH